MATSVRFGNSANKIFKGKTKHATISTMCDPFFKKNILSIPTESDGVHAAVDARTGVAVTVALAVGVERRRQRRDVDAGVGDHARPTRRHGPPGAVVGRSR